MEKRMFRVSNLRVSVEGKEILKGLSLDIKPGEIHVLMGPNGSGKSTLAQTIMGHPKYTVVGGKISFNGKNLLDLKPNERSKQGVFLSFQYPSELEGVTISSFLRLIYNNSHDRKLSPVAFRKILKEKTELLEIKEEFMSRYLNEGFSGGEKKKMEILQMLILEPRMAILDEVDSGLDIDALKLVSEAVNYLHEKNKSSILIITHYTRILKYIKPGFVHIMQNGIIVKSGGGKLADDLEEKGYAPFGE
jgi:Fe-S cluster assembly ATP-binding protein